MTQTSSRVLYVITCAAPLASHIHEFIVQAQSANWDVCLIATPQASRFIDIPTLTALTGHTVRTDYKMPGEADPLPKAEAIVVVPATFNTLNKLAAGIGDTLAASILCECLGRGSPPIVAVPYLKPDLAHHPAFFKNLALLKEWGVHILYDPETYPSPDIISWKTILDMLEHLCNADASS